MGLTKPTTNRPRVVFPHPDSPTTATTELGSTSRLTAFNTGSSLVVVG